MISSQLNEQFILQRNNFKRNFQKSLAKWSLISFFLCFFLIINWIFVAYNFKSQPISIAISTNSNIQLKQSSKIQTKLPIFETRLPKILWIYTENELETESMTEMIYLEYNIQKAKQLGYEVRTVNSLSVYDYLSQKTIARISIAMQNRKVNEAVHSILKLAILKDQGGILLNSFDTIFLGQNFNWIEEMFKNQDSQIDQEKYNCKPSNSYLWMLHKSDITYGNRYIDPILVSIPDSNIISQAFTLSLNYLVTGTFPFGSQFNIVHYNNDIGVYFISNLLEESINMVMYEYLSQVSSSEKSTCSKYGIQDHKKNIDIFYSMLNPYEKESIIFDQNPEQKLKSILGRQQVFIIRGLNSGPLPNIFRLLIKNIVNNQNNQIPKYSPLSILGRILNNPENKKIFLVPQSQRKIELCLIIMDELTYPEIDKKFLEKFSKQTYSRWKQIMFVKNLNQFNQLSSEKFIFINSSLNLVRNIEVATLKYCSKQGYVILLHQNENFNSIRALEEIAKATSPRDVIGAFISLNINGKIAFVNPAHLNFHRGRDAIVNPKIYHLESVINHMRIFSVESFKYIPQFDLRDIQGNYFNDRLIFLMTLLEMIRTEINDPNYLYVIKRYSSEWNVPRKAVIINNQINLQIFHWERADNQQLEKTRSRLECQQIAETMHNLFKWKIPFTKILAFNNADQFVPVDKKQGPDIIPKVIHQVWLGTKYLPPAKKYFVAKTSVMYSDFEVKLWREQNITKQNFPLTYQIIKNLIDFSKKSPYNKLATVTDIIRHQLLYHQGGFWKDAGMNILRRIFHKFTKYKIAIAVDKTFRYRWLQGMCFFANAPRIENMWRMTNFKNINRMNIYHSYASSIAGPIDFRQFIIGQEQYDPQILCMPYETFYPAQVTQHPEKDLCTKKIQELKQNEFDESYEISENGWFLLKNCSEIYPYAYAVEHNRFGDSWSKRRTNM